MSSLRVRNGLTAARCVKSTVSFRPRAVQLASETPRESLEATARNTLGNPANLPTALRHCITYLHVAKFESIATADIAL